MATSFFFDNKIVKLPGAYSTIVSGEQSQPLALDYGKVLVIDTGVAGASWGGGAGINGELTSGKDAIYTFEDLGNYQAYLKGGLFWKCAEALFKPDKKTGALGVSQVVHARAATTTKSQMTFTAVGGASNGGSFKVNTKDEGLNANGVLTTTHLDNGYAYKVETGTVDVTKWTFSIWLGTYKGLHTDSISYDELTKAQSDAILLVTSPEFNNIQTLLDWANTNSTFGKYFELDSTSAIAGDGSVDQADITALSGYQVSIGGTETFTEANLNLILDAVTDEDFSFIIIDQYGTVNYDSSESDAIIEFINGDSKFKRFQYVGGGANEDEFSGVDSSLAMGAYFNSSYVNVVHAEIGLASDAVAGGFRYWPSLYHACLIIGRTAGKEVQVPSTNKSLGIDKLRHNLTKKQMEQALDAGVKVTKWNQYTKRFVCLQDVNTLQDNTRLFNTKGESFSSQFMRIVVQINKELVVNSEIDLLSDENGVNANTLNPGELKNWTETYLENRLAEPDDDNLLLDYRDVTVTKVADAYQVSYGIVVNNEINKIFFTGFLFS